jgi:hypothetical protein
MKKHKENFKNVIDFENKMMKKYGWYVHFIMREDNTPFGINIHTHGLHETYNHKDLQICIPLPQRVAHQILINIVNEIKNGTTFSPGIKYENILLNYKIELIEAKEGGREILRVIIPDADGEYKNEYLKQFENTGME